MNVTRAAITDVLVIEPKVYQDDRGFFFEVFQAKRYAEHGVAAVMVQDNHSGSRQGVLRGLHYQIGRPQGKLIRVVAGDIFDVAVDLRRSSATFGRWVGYRLSSANRRQMWIPPGFAHGFYVLSDWAEVTYKVDEFYSPQDERTLLWNDPTLAIDWPLTNGQAPLLSGKDARGLPLAEVETYD
jgi:dTDP-4-dehydrorhamnose 3,5-epimerase